ncbi:hypothetical protein [Kordiimonas aestuarii]|uniref:hypothetical protein n=1 Tax=Kordiimonas aestuarii TaxID=1005925 RepID=UPI0021D311F1|nr:hypothetical protein [Kordiimonas aestuarii]
MTRFFRSLSHLALAAAIASTSALPVVAGASVSVGEMPNVAVTPATADLMASLSTRPASSRMLGVASPAHDFVRFTGAVKNLSLLLLHDVKEEAHVKAAIKQYGFEKVQDTVVSAIRTAQLQYGAKWADMLAGIYDTHFNARELRSILQEKESSPHFVKLIEEQDAIAQAVRIDGHDIYVAARAQVMSQLEAAL